MEEKVHLRAWTSLEDQALYPADYTFHVFGVERARREARKLIDEDGFAVVHLIGVPTSFEKIV